MLFRFFSGGESIESLRPRSIFRIISNRHEVIVLPLYDGDIPSFAVLFYVQDLVTLCRSGEIVSRFFVRKLLFDLPNMVSK